MNFFDLFKKKAKSSKASEINMKEDKYSEERYNEINKIYTDAWIRLDDKCNFGDNTELLSEAEKAVYVVICFMNETYNGGFEQFLFNSTGAHFGLLESSLKKVGLENVYEIYSDIFPLLPWELPSDEDERDKILFGIINDNISQRISDCDAIFDELDETELQETVCNYIMANRDSFDFIK